MEFKSLRQFKIIVKKNLILQKRYWKSTLLKTFILPIGFLFVLYILQKARNNSDSKTELNPKSYNLEPVLPCTKSDNLCITFMVTPKVPVVEKIMATFINNNKKRLDNEGIIDDSPVQDDVLIDMTPPSSKKALVWVSNEDALYEYAIRNPNTTLYGLSFTIPPLTNQIFYKLWFEPSVSVNITNGDPYGRQLLSIYRGVDESICMEKEWEFLSHMFDFLDDYYTELRDGSISNQNQINIQLKDWPLIPSTVLGDGIIMALGAAFFFASLMIVSVSILSSIVFEKELRLRQSLEMVGLNSQIYWVATYVSNSIFFAIIAFTTSIFGIAFGFKFFTESNFAITFLLFFLFGLSLLSMCCFVSVFCRTSKTAIMAGLVLIILGSVFEQFIFSNPFTGFIWWSDIAPSILRKLLVLIPFFNFGKFFLDAAMLTSGRRDALTDTFIPGVGFNWSRLYEKIPENLLLPYDSSGKLPDVPPPVDSWYLLIMNIFLYYILAIYLDQVIPDEFGRKRHPLFIFIGIWKKCFPGKSALSQDKLEKFTLSDEEESVSEERRTCYDDKNAPFKIINLRKVFFKKNINPFKKSQIDKIAIHNSCLILQESQLLSLLGQNGAGKSTTMNILSGLTPASAGNAFIYGLNACNSDDMDEIRKILGVCPQHDLLYDDLTADEHFELYGGLKELSIAEIKRLANERLDAVRLSQVRDKVAKSYSGGMKRRLSVIISTIGDPKVVLMDEPTTGMDPLNRRFVWKFLESFKKGRIIVLTTHSMEEADILSDRVAIMAHGKIKAIGTSIGLKSKFGAGYRLYVHAFPSSLDHIKDIVSKTIQTAILEDESAGGLLYKIPRDDTQLIPLFVKYVEELPLVTEMIKAWGVSQTTLEEVFLNVIREANPGGYSGYDPSQKKNE